MLYGGRANTERPRKFLSLSELGYTWLFIGVLLQESSPTFDKVSELATKLAKAGELLHDPYFITFDRVFLDKNLGPVDSIYQRLETPDFGISFLYRAQNSKSGFSQSNQVLLLTTPENTITYRNTVCWSLRQNSA